MTNIFINGVPPKTNELDLAKLFDPFARVNTVHIVCDKRTGKPKGTAFIELHDASEAVEAVANLDGIAFGDSTLIVRIADDKPEKQPQNRQFNAPGGYYKVEQPEKTQKQKRPRIQR